MSNMAEIMIVPSPNMSHVVSILQLAKIILKKYDFISVTVLVIELPAQSEKITSYIDCQSHDNPYPTRLKFVTLPPLSNVPDASLPSFFLDVIELNKPLVKRVIEDRVKHGSPKPVGFVVDMFAIEALQISDDKKIPPIYPVGPILELYNRESNSNNVEKISILSWLDGQPKSSVVFLCFGSLGTFDEEQVREIANGLEKSGFRFLWTLRKPPSVGELQAPGIDEAYLEGLPEGFVDRTTNIGKIIEWAPQVDVLTHPAIGGFVSHCGWNSVLESMRFGVPIGAWPMYAEQNLNAFELVEELKLAVEIRLDYVMNWSSGKGNFIVSATDIEEGLKKLMSMDENMKKNVKDMGDKGRKALEDGGSSSHWLDRFINDVTST